MAEDKTLNLNQNVMIRACAGAGKTYQLTQRYLAILDEFATEKRYGPQNILVITFTRKATAEMANRIYQKVFEIIKSQKTEASDFPNLSAADEDYKSKVMQDFSAPKITTIDSFCFQVLKDNPVAADIDPNLDIGDEAKIEETLETALDDFIKNLSQNYDSRLKNLIDGMGLDLIKIYFRFLEKNRDQIAPIQKFYQNNSDDEIFSILKKRYEPNLPMNEAVSTFQTIVEKVLNQPFPSEILQQWQQHLDAIHEYQNCTAEQKSACYKKQIHPVFLKSDGKNYLKSISVGSQKMWRQNGCSVKEQKAFVAETKEFSLWLNENLPIDSLDGIFTEKDLLAISMSRLLLELSQEFFEFVDQRKERENTLSFNDITRKAHHILTTQKKIAQKYHKQFQHILVDEFQDTNDLRWGIIRTIASDENGNLRKRGLFIVGDEKQSIYRFTKADVKIMARAEDELAEVESEFRPVPSDATYRQSPWLIENCINPLFLKLLQPEEKKRQNWEAKFIETQYPSETKPKEDQKLDSVAPTIFDLDILTVPKSEQELFKEDVLAYPRHVAELIQNLKNRSDWDKITVPLGQPKIGVLLRTIAGNITLYREAFKQVGIDFEVIGGKGFFKRQEVMDIEMILSILINPHDDVAMIGLLRSPIFAFDDKTINQFLQNPRKDKSIYESLDHFEFPEVKSELDEWLTKSRTEPLDRLLYRIFEENHRDLGYFSETDGIQRWENIQKCINLVHQWSNKGMNLAKIKETLKFKINTDDEEGFFPFPTTSEVVLMSIHKAKGLQFPIVVVPDLHRKFNFSTDSIAIESIQDHGKKWNTELGLKIQCLDGNREKTAIFNHIQQQIRREKFAELQRLFYVAVTRAKYGVVLSGMLKESKNGYPKLKTDNWLDWLRESYEISQEQLESCNFQSQKGIPQISVNDYQKPVDKFAPKSTKIEKLILENEATDFTKFYRKRVRDISAIFPSQSAKNENSTLGGSDFGSLIHKIFEMDWLNWDKHSEEIIQWLDSQSFFKLKKQMPEIEKYLRNLWQSEHCQFLQNIENKFCEHPISCLLFSEDKAIELNGIIDLLYKNEDDWTVLDYKTDATQNDLAQHRAQVQIYLHAVKHLYHFEPRGEIFYTTLGIVENVPFDPYFLGNLEFQGAKSWNIDNLQFLSQKNEILWDKLEEPLKNLSENNFVIAPTKRRAQEIKMILASQKILKPSHTITTLDEMGSNLLLSGKREITSLQRRFLVRKIFNNSFSGQNFDRYPGYISHLAQAFEMVDKNRAKPNWQIEKYYQKYLETIEQAGYTENTLPLLPQQFDLSEKHLIIDGCISVSIQEIEVLQQLSQQAKSVTYLTLNGSKHEFFDYDPEVIVSIDTKKTDKFLLPYNVNLELEQIAKDIKNKVENEQESYRNFMIVVPSMEKYVPCLLPIFRRFKIPVTLTKREPLMERPVVGVAFALFQIMTQHELSWHTIMHWFSFPSVAEKSDSEFLKNLRQIDLKIRQNCEIDWNNLKKKDLHKILKDKQLERIFSNIRKEIESFRQFEKRNFGIHYEQKLSENLQHEGDSMESRALQRFLEIVQNLNQMQEQNSIFLQPFAYFQELQELVKSAEISTAEQNWGVRVISTFESVKLHPKFLFAIGLSQEDFPTQSKKNIFIEDDSDFHYQSNRSIFSSWQENAEKLFLSCPQKGTDGKDQQYSIFLEGMKAEAMPDVGGDTNYFRKKRATNKFLKNDADDPILRRQILRHNAMLKNPLDSEYFGKIETPQLKLAKQTFSATKLDELAERPLYFLIARGWGIKETDREISSYLTVGNVIHTILERFGKLGGWDENRKNPTKAKKLMHDTAQKLLEEEKMDFENDLEVYAMFAPFLRGLQDDAPAGLLANILAEENDFYPQFQFIGAEQSFGITKEKNTWQAFTLSHETLDNLKFCGKIDRFDRHTDAKIVIGMDYKTGRIYWSGTMEKLSLQLPLYYLALKSHFPEDTILLTYRGFKPNACGFHSSWLGDAHPAEIPEINYKSKALSHILTENSGENYKNHLFQVLQPLETGNFPLVQKGIKKDKAKYYYLEGVSRIETVKYITDSKIDHHD
ncbi:MAG: UvrD-helicase domain-containing protein [Candidatus Marinimicrobia bacterium]|nr:UvrD-helicase domain-containing protein [Candidatus Neomarinimicrobiota bacterium]